MCGDAIRKYDAESCKAYREEIDTLLVFAGLFSAVVTAFTIESYQWLQNDPNDAIIALLSQIAHPGNETRDIPAPQGLPDAVSARINVYWFLSLALSLSAALIAILCKQWVREFERHADQSHEEFIRVRQMKFEGFEQWGVAAIIATVPLLLQSALGLFAAGVIELLWHLHRIVAIVVLVPTAAAFVFYALTTLLPGLQAVCSPFCSFRRIAQCPFKSPQAILTVTILLWRPGAVQYCVAGLQYLWHRLRCTPLVRKDDEYELFLSFGHTESWLTIDREFSGLREKAYARDEYRLREQRGHGQEAVPPPFCFSALSWLHQHVYQPGMNCRTWLCVWDMATRAENENSDSSSRSNVRGDSLHSDSSSRSNVRGDSLRLHFTSGMLHLTGDLFRTSTPSGMALCYGLAADLEPAFIAECFINLLPSLDLDTALHIYHWMVPRLGDDQMHSVVCAMITLSGRKTNTQGIDVPPALRRLILEVGIDTRYLRPISQLERACVIAHYFRELRTHGVTISDAKGDLQKLLAVTINYLSYDHDDPGAPHYAAQRAVFSALARTVNVCVSTFRPDPEKIDKFHDIYLSLLSGDAQDDLAAKDETRFADFYGRSTAVAVSFVRSDDMTVVYCSVTHVYDGPEDDTHSSETCLAMQRWAQMSEEEEKFRRAIHDLTDSSPGRSSGSWRGRWALFLAKSLSPLFRNHTRGQSTPSLPSGSSV